MSYKECKRCGSPLPEGVGRARKYCDECQKETRAEANRKSSLKYAATHKEQIKAYARNRYATDEEYRQYVLEKGKRWAKAHPERMKELRQQWHERKKSGTV